MNPVIPPSEIIAIIKFKQEELRRVSITRPEQTLYLQQINLLNTYVDKVIAEVTTKVAEYQRATTSQKITIYSTQMPNTAPEAVESTVEVKGVHVPTPQEVTQQIIEDKIPDNIGNFEDAIKEDILKAYKSGSRDYTLKLINHFFFNGTCNKEQDLLVVLNELLGTDPLKSFKRKVYTLYDENKGDFSVAFAWAKRNLPSTFTLTPDVKQNNIIIQKIVWNAINELSPTRREELAKRAAKKAAN